MLTPEEELQQTLNAGNDKKEVTQTGTGNATPPKAAEQPMQADNFWATGEVNTAPPVTETVTNTNTGATGTKPADQAAPTNTATQQAAANGTRITRETINTSARTAVSAINLAQITILRPLMNWRFMKESEKRFGEKLSRAQEMIMDDSTPTDAQEKSLKNRFKKFLDQRDAKIKEIPFTDEEEQDMERAFKSYFEMKNQAMSPEILLYTALISTIGKRAVDVVMWD